MDLSGHYATPINYSCDQGWCNSRWVKVEYDCVPGMDIKLLCPKNLWDVLFLTQADRYEGLKYCMIILKKSKPMSCNTS